MSNEGLCQDTKVLTVTLSMLVRQLSKMTPGVERDLLAAEMSEVKAELVARQQERQLCVGMK
jgi:hypothetical protein